MKCVHDSTPCRSKRLAEANPMRWLGWVFCLMVTHALMAADVPLDLSSAANRGFVDQTANDGQGGWSDQGPTNCLTQIPTGNLQWNGIQLHVMDPAQHQGRSVAAFNSANNPTALQGMTLTVPGGQLAKVRALYLLHTLIWAEKSMDGQSFGTIRANYPHGKTLAFDLKIGTDGANWWKPHNVSNGLVVYSEVNGQAKVGLYLSRFELPPDRGQPESITFTTANGAMWIVVAATVSDIWRRPLPTDSGPWVVTANDQWKPYDQSDVLVKKGTALDFSSLVESGPAGKHGRVIINDRGRLAFADDPQRDVRFLGASYGMEAFPYQTDEDLTQIAQQLTRGGYNVVRPHFLDAMLMKGAKQDLVFNPEQWDRWDRFAAILKKHGIYLYLDLTTSWSMFRAVPLWTPQSRQIDMNVRTFFDPQAQEHWKRGVKQFLEHVNPYTGTTLKDDPQVIVMQLRNEVGLHFQGQWILSPKGSADKPLAGLLTDHFRQWLKRRYCSVEKWKTAWTWINARGQQQRLVADGQTFDTITPPPLDGSGPDTADLMRFFTETEVNTYRWMSQYLQQELGVRTPLNDYNNDTTNQATFSRSALSLIDTHGYIGHPTMTTQPGSIQSQISTIEMESDTFGRMACVRQIGKPMVCTEWGQPFWNRWRYEAGLVFPSYASLQGWQMLTHHAEAVWLRPDRFILPLTSFRIAYDPPLKASERMSALLFGRGDVQTSSHLAQINLEAEDIYRRGLAATSVPGNLNRLAMICRLGVQVTRVPDAQPGANERPDIIVSPTGGDLMMRVAGAEQAVQMRSTTDASSLQSALIALKRNGALPKENATDPIRGLFQSDTGQLTLDRPNRIMAVDTPMSQGAALALKEHPMALSCATFINHDAPMGVLISSLTDRPIQSSPRLLLIVATDALNSGMTFTNPSAEELIQQGTLPVLMRTTRLTLRLRHDQAGQLELWALAANGMRVENIPLQSENQTAIAMINTGMLKNGPTPYFEIRVRESTPSIP